METQKVSLLTSESMDQAFLLAMDPQNHDSFNVGEFLTIGRDLTNSIQLHDPFVSSRHVRIEKRSRGYLLRDLQSRNGTYLNGTSVVEAYLSNNDKILIGESVFVFSKMDKKQNSMSSDNKDWNRELQRIPAIANTDFTVLVIGPSGSGKELISRWIHDNSPRQEGPYITINCSALSESLIESELFGHVRGAFTGATEDRKGAFEAARGGTLFLDEIGDLPLSLQPKLLRALENNEIRPVGSDRTIKTDVRIVAATHKNIKQRVIKGEFREDLYHRLNICRVSPPPLIDRMEDFDSLIYKFAKDHRVAFSFNAVEKLKNHLWPGNIRELKNLVVRAAAYFPGQRIELDHIPQIMDKELAEGNVRLITNEEKELPPMKEIERELILQKLQKHFGNQRKAAEELQMPKSTFHDKLKVYKINPRHFKKRGKVV
ncbi:MAG: sigma 54-dependent Fis family transcriptional regulator [Bdellovibrionales bacterium]|nr:sigma 54-dependent Fis family transcriptional regulator [Bdellovibrionales bacterium]